MPPTDQAPDHSLTTFDTVIVDKASLLSTLKTNRERHAEVFETASAGYWAQVQATLAAKPEEFNAALDKTKATFAEEIGKGLVQFQHQQTGYAHAVAQKDRTKLGSFGSVGSCWSVDFGTSWLPSFPVNYLEDYDRAIKKLEFSVADKVQLSTTEFDSYVCNNWKWKQAFVTSSIGLIQNVSGMLMSSNASYRNSASYAIAVSGCAGL